MKRSVLAGLAAAAMLFGLAGRAPADELKLIFVTLDPPRAQLNVRIHHPWAAKINREAKGLFKIDVRDGMALANYGNVYSRVLHDMAQIGWGLQVYSPGKFPLTSVVTLPFLSKSSEVASTAFWRLYKTGLLDKEYDQVVPLKLVVFPQSGVHYRERPKTLDGLEGLKVIAGGEVSFDIVQALGGAPISLRANEYYEGLRRGIADAVIVGWTAFQPFKLAEVTHYHVEAQLGATPGFVFMTRKKLASLPAKVRDIIMANSTEKESRAFGKFWDEVAGEGRAMTMRHQGQTIFKLNSGQEARWREHVAPIIEEWAKATPGGQKVLDTYRDLLIKVARSM